MWVDGIDLKVRLEQDKVCLLAMIGVRADGQKELVALADGFRESAESWADLLRDCKRRGMRAPVLAVGDGALGFRKALRDVSPTPASSGVGSTFRRMSLLRCPSRRTPAPRAPWRTSMPRTRTTHARPPKRSRPATAPSGPRQRRRSPSTLTCCSRSTTTPPSTGSPGTTNPIEPTFATLR